MREGSMDAKFPAKVILEGDVSGARQEQQFTGFGMMTKQQQNVSTQTILSAQSFWNGELFLQLWYYNICKTYILCNLPELVGKHSTF